jgi:hypothetical protein
MQLSYNKVRFFIIFTGTKRTLERQRTTLENGNSLHLGYKHLPLLPDIDYEMIVIDLLHMFLRVSDVLFDLLIDSIFRADRLEPNSLFDYERHKSTAILANFLNQKCKRNKTPSGLKLLELRENLTQNWTGGSKRILFEEITKEISNINILFGNNFEKTLEVSQIWEKFWKLDIMLRSDEAISAKSIEDKTKEIYKLFTKTYALQKITPYIHFLFYHLHESYSKFGNLNYYSAQGLEKLNDLSTYQFFGSTNKSKNFIKQLLEKDFRIGFLEDEFIY